MAVSYTTTGDSFSSGTPHPWSPTTVRRIGGQQHVDVAHDGKGIIAFPMAPTAEGTANLHATFLLNFGDELKRRVPSGR